jgi:hypothetical protein
MENNETQGWLEFSLACNYISKETYITLYALFDELGRVVQYMMNNPDKFGAG